MSAAAPPTSADSGHSAGLGASLPVIVVGRLFTNILTRFPFAFVRPLADGLGIRLEAATAVLGLRELAGLTTGAVGRWADHGHERRAIVWTSAVSGISAIACGAVRGVGWFALAMVILGVSTFGLHAAQTSWVSHRVPFEGRARVLGITELTWGGAFVVGAPLAAWLIDEGGWRLPFVVFGSVMVVLAAVAWLLMPPDVREDDDEPPAQWRHLAHVARRGWALVAYFALQPFAQMIVFAVVGDWFVQRLGMSLGQVGAASLLLGVGDVIGTSATIAFADRIGPARAGAYGMAVAVPLAAAMGLVGGNAALGVGLLLALTVSLEFSFVSAFPLLTELAPDSRAAMIGAGIGLMTLARAVSAALAGWIYVTGGIVTTGLVAGGLGALAAACLWHVRHGTPGPTTALDRMAVTDAHG